MQALYSLGIERQEGGFFPVMERWRAQWTARSKGGLREGLKVG